MDAVLAAKLLMGLSILAEAEKVAVNAGPIFDELRKQAGQGAKFEDLMNYIRSKTVADETDAQAAIDKIPG
jgi:hypothetical protein